jgi:peptide deformylase
MEVCCDADQGIGLSAVQVGIPWRLFIIKGDGTSLVPKGQYDYFVNCEYEPVTEEEQIVSVEGCLSVRSQEGQLRFFHVERHKSIRLYGYKLAYNIDESGKSRRLDFEKFDEELGSAEKGIVVQHELDHQRGILISDCGREIFIWK